jgi:ankyrin repeat protein
MEYIPYQDGNTRLHWLASLPKKNRVLEYVLNRLPQANRLAAINTRNSLGQTPLHAACNSQNFSAAALLTKYGALNISDSHGEKPFDFISQSLSKRSDRRVVN